MSERTILLLSEKLYGVDETIDSIMSELKKLKKRRAVIEEKLLEKLGKSGMTAVKMRVGTAKVRTSKYPTISDRRKLDKYIASNDAYDLYQSRVNSKAYFDRLSSGEKIPGVSVFERQSISINRR
jgi:hypothetical protein